MKYGWGEIYAEINGDKLYDNCFEFYPENYGDSEEEYRGMIDLKRVGLFMNC